MTDAFTYAELDEILRGSGHSGAIGMSEEVAEVVTDGDNGLLVPSGDTDALAAAIRRYFADDGLRERLRASAASSVAAYAPDRVFAQLEETLLAVAR